jgi:hypothetical protein
VSSNGGRGGTKQLKRECESNRYRVSRRRATDV